MTNATNILLRNFVATASKYRLVLCAWYCCVMLYPLLSKSLSNRSAASLEIAGDRFMLEVGVGSDELAKGFTLRFHGNYIDKTYLVLVQVSASNAAALLTFTESSYKIIAQ